MSIYSGKKQYQTDSKESLPSREPAIISVEVSFILNYLVIANIWFQEFSIWSEYDVALSEGPLGSHMLLYIVVVNSPIDRFWSPMDINRISFFFFFFNGLKIYREGLMMCKFTILKKQLQITCKPQSQLFCQFMIMLVSLSPSPLEGQISNEYCFFLFS